MENEKIVLIMYQRSIVARGIDNKLKEMGYETTTVIGSVDIAVDNVPDGSLFVIFLPDDIMEDDLKINPLRVLFDAAIRNNVNMICIGEASYHDDLVKLVPDVEDAEWVDRPVDVKTFGDRVKNILEARKITGGKKRILIVDDDPSYARMVREWIKSQYRVDIVTAGMQAISFLLKVEDTEKVDLILLDYEMPVVDGPQVLQMLRQDAATKDIPVIFLTGNGTKEAVSRVMALKPSGYILKTASRNELLKVLREKV